MLCVSIKNYLLVIYEKEKDAQVQKLAKLDIPVADIWTSRQAVQLTHILLLLVIMLAVIRN